MNGFADFFKKHIWQIGTAVVTIIVAWTILTRDVQDMELKLKEVEAKVSANAACQQEVKERLVRVETKIDYLIDENEKTK